MTTRLWCRQPRRPRAVVGAVSLMWSIAVLTAGPVSAASTDVCFSLNGSAGRIGGLQLDLTWDSSCMSVERASGAAAHCTSNAATGKNVQTAVGNDNHSMRALFFSMSDPSPIADAELFCCKFTVANPAAGGCCSLNMGNVIFAGPSGGRFYDADISIEVSMAGAPCTAANASGSQSQPVRPPAFAAQMQPPVVPNPVVVAPPPVGQAAQAPAPVGQAPAGQAPAGLAPAAQAPAGQAPSGSNLVPSIAGQAAPTPTPATATPAAAASAARTPAIHATATPATRTPHPAATPTGSPAGSTTPAATTPTPHSHHHKKHHTE